MAKKKKVRLARGSGAGYEKNKTLYRFGEHNAWLYQREGSRRGTWYLRFYIAKEDLNIRKSLKTTSLTEAKSLAFEELSSIKADVKAGRKIGSQTIAEAIRDYQKVLDERVARSLIKKRTRYIHNLNIERVRGYLASALRFGVQTKVGDIDGSQDFKGYWDYRKTQNSAIGGYSVNLELSSFHLVLANAEEKGFCSKQSLGFVDHSFQREAGRAEIQDEGDYEVMLLGMRKFKSTLSTHKNLSGKKEINIYYYLLMRHLFLVAAHCGARTGELLNLKNKNIKRLDEESQEVYVHFEDTKTDLRGKTRKKGRDAFIGASLKGVNYLIRWIKEHRRFEGDEDYVFSTYTRGKSSAKDAYYLYYKTLCEYLRTQDGDYARVASYFDTYHCRHFYITRAIEFGNSLEVIATACGNSAATIARDYNHLLGSKAGKLIHAARYERISALEEATAISAAKDEEGSEENEGSEKVSEFKADGSISKDGVISIDVEAFAGMKNKATI
jgi:hypothetical protein